MRTGQIQIIVYRVINGGVSYLLLKRSAAKGGFWQPITGGIEPGEEDHKALSRELNEELGILHPIQITPLIYEFSFPIEQGSALQERVYGVEIGKDQEISLSSEHTEYVWLSYEDATKRLKWDSNKQALTNLDSYIRSNMNDQKS